ncbi:MAG: hypothetical protein M3Q73_01880 [bacterium]|nr:hypothetical protein [bacterium]
MKNWIPFFVGFGLALVVLIGQYITGGVPTGKDLLGQTIVMIISGGGLTLAIIKVIVDGKPKVRV